MIIRNDNDLIGDFIGTIPAMQEMTRICTERGEYCRFIVKPGKDDLLQMSQLIKAKDDAKHDLAFDLHAAFNLAARKDLHMTQANFEALGLPIPDKPIGGFLTRPFMGTVHSYDYVLSPFSRSLPPEQRWPRERWQALVDSMPDKTFTIIGSNIDDKDYIVGSNVYNNFGWPLYIVASLLVNSKHGLVSVVTGTSHLAHALGVKNYLLTCNQGTWGKNPEAKQLNRPLLNLSVDTVRNFILNG